MTIAVITATRRRVEPLRRAMSSVKRQTVKDTVKHFIVVDDCSDTAAYLSNLSDPGVEYIYCERSAEDATGPERAARLRNIALDSVSTDWVAFLDDDNVFHSSHLAELRELSIRTACPAVYSYRELLNEDGSPYLHERSPWIPEEVDARAEYQRLVAEGVFVPGSNIMRDGCRTNALTVDTSEWLVRTDLAAVVRFREVYTPTEVESLTTEDDTFLAGVLEAGTSPETTGLATLYYYMGGYTTNLLESEWKPIAERAQKEV